MSMEVIESEARFLPNMQEKDTEHKKTKQEPCKSNLLKKESANQQEITHQPPG